MTNSELKELLMSSVAEGADTGAIFGKILSDFDETVAGLNTQLTALTTERDGLQTKLTDNQKTIDDITKKNDELKQTNLALFAKIPTDPVPQETKKETDYSTITVDDIIKGDY